METVSLIPIRSRSFFMYFLASWRSSISLMNGTHIWSIIPSISVSSVTAVECCSFWAKSMPFITVIFSASSSHTTTLQPLALNTVDYDFISKVLLLLFDRNSVPLHLTSVCGGKTKLVEFWPRLCVHGAWID